MKKNLCLIVSALVLACSAHLHAVFIFDSSSGDVTGDFRYCQVGNGGSSASSKTQMVYDSSNKTILLEGQYGTSASVGLNATSSEIGLNNGFYSGNVTSSMTFTYLNGDSTNVGIGLGVRVSASGGVINTYPTYRVQIVGGNFTLQKNYGYSTTVDFGTYALGATLGSTNIYQMSLSAADTGTNAFGKIVNVTASLYANGGLVQTLSYLETPTSSSVGNVGASISSGYIGMFAGESGVNTGNFRGISISQFSVVPEPSTVALIGLGALVLGLVRRRWA